MGILVKKKRATKETISMTPLRLSLLRFLLSRPRCRISSLADAIAPRKNGWSAQGAARWGGGYVRPLEIAGLVVVNRRVESGVGDVSITEAGRLIIEGCDLKDADLISHTERAHA